MRMQFAAAVVCLSTIALAHAGDARAEESESGAGKLDEVIVTAEKREANLQEVPFGISALSGEDLERTGATGAQDYLSQIAGVHYIAAGRGRSVIVMRGISTEGHAFNNLQRTAEVYVDELPLLDRFGGWTQPDMSTFDMERVEVLRGPQGTLFGSGALGGAVRMITNGPDTSRFQGKVEIGQAFTHGGDDSNSLYGMVNVPLVQDTVALRAVAFRRSDGGYVDNVVRHQDNVDSGRGEGGRLMLGITPSEALKVRLTAMHERDTLDDSSLVYSTPEDGPSDEWNGIIPERSVETLDIFNLTVDYSFGPTALTSITTYGIRDSYLATDWVAILEGIANTGFDPNNNDIWITRDSKRFAQELRLTSTTEGPLQWTVGGFFMNYRGDTHQFWDLGAAHVIGIDDKAYVRTDEAAAFGEATYRFTEKWSLTAGARWAHNTFQLENVSGPEALIQQNVPVQKVSSSATTPKLSVSFRPTEDVHLYATAAKGFRIGQVNFDAFVDPEIPVAFEPDSLWNYEVGIKSIWFDDRLRANVAAYHIDWSDIQLERVISVGGFNRNFIDNGGKARINGVEVELVTRPTAALEIGSSLTYNDAKLKSVREGVPLTVGSTLPGSPKFSASNYIQAITHFNEETSGYVRLDHQYVGEVYSSINNDNVSSDTYNKLDLRAGVNFQRYEFQFYVANLTDNDAAINRLDLLQPNPSANRLRPRTAGVAFRAAY